MISDDVALLSDTAEPTWTGLAGVERAIVRTLVWELLAHDTIARSPEETFSAVCETVMSYLPLISAGFFKRIAGQSRVFVWSAPGVDAPSQTAAREHVSRSAAGLLSGDPPHVGGNTAHAVLSDEQLGLSAVLCVESTHALDSGDRALLADVLRRLLDQPVTDW
jgi:hypothetical protein